MATTKKVPGTLDSGDFFDAYGLLRAMHSRNPTQYPERS